MKTTIEIKEKIENKRVSKKTIITFEDFIMPDHLCFSQKPNEIYVADDDRKVIFEIEHPVVSPCGIYNYPDRSVNLNWKYIESSFDLIQMEKPFDITINWKENRIKLEGCFIITCGTNTGFNCKFDKIFIEGEEAKQLFPPFIQETNVSKSSSEDNENKETPKYSPPGVYVASEKQIATTESFSLGDELAHSTSSIYKNLGVPENQQEIKEGSIVSFKHYFGKVMDVSKDVQKALVNWGDYVSWKDLDSLELQEEPVEEVATVIIKADREKRVKELKKKYTPLNYKNPLLESLFTINQKELCETFLNYFGERIQLLKMGEEAAEVSAAIVKQHINKDDPEQLIKIYEEITDLLILLYQFKSNDETTWAKQMSKLFPLKFAKMDLILQKKKAETEVKRYKRAAIVDTYHLKDLENNLNDIINMLKYF